MYFQFRELVTKGNTVNFHQTMNMNHVIEGRQDITYIGPLQIDLVARPESGGVIDVQGELTTQLNMNCSRCLTPLTETYVIPFHERFKQTEKSVEAPEVDEDDDIELIAEDKVDLQPYVEETLYMNLPYVPLCDKACKGLCPSCGQNLNEQSCGCSNEKIDPRLAGLKDFFKS